MVEVVVFEKLLHEPAGAMLSMEDGVRVRVLLAITIQLSIISTLDGSLLFLHPVVGTEGFYFSTKTWTLA